MTVKPRPEIKKLAQVHHGAPDYAELESLGLTADEVLDFSVNSNPYGPSPAVRQAIEGVPLDRYPDRDTLGLRRALSHHYDTPIDCILPGNGAAELIWLVALTYLQPGDRVLILGPTFGEYAKAAALMGTEVHEWRAQPDDNFTFNSPQITQQISRNRYRLVFVCNPNNPTGQAISLDRINQWTQKFPKTLFVIDEAYLAFAMGMESAISLKSPNILVLRSMTKEYALAGLRLGYAVGDEAVIAALDKARPPWSVNALAQVAGIAALEDQGFLHTCLRKIHAGKETLVAGLVELGISPVPSQTHYFLLPVGNGATFRSQMLRRGLQVRDCASFGLPAYVRIATRKAGENQRLLTAVGELSKPQM